MKTLSNFSIMALAMVTLMAFASINSIRYEKPIELNIKPIEITNVIPELKVEELEIPSNRHVDFLQAIGGKESGNNYSVVNTYGYMGKYQFGPSTLKGLGFKVSKQEFLDNPALQEEAMQALLEHNHRKLRKYIEKYCGQTINGVYVTESGILAAAHLAGQGNVKRFFRKGYEFKDGYGTSLTSYMQKFSGYQLDLN